MSKHIQFESNMTLSGANADKRIPVTPSQQKLVLAKLYAYVKRKFCFRRFMKLLMLKLNQLQNKSKKQVLKLL